MGYYLIIALQGFCVYHCYANRNNYYWILAIIFLPLVGSILYLFMNVFQRRDIEKVQESLVTVINPSKKIKDLEKKLRFSETFENRVALADAYLNEGMNMGAIENYKASLKDVFANDFYVISKLVEAYYFSDDFDNAIQTAKRIENDSRFRKSKSSFLYGMALEKRNDPISAEEYLRAFDAPYSNYRERLELARFLIRQDRMADGKLVYQEMISESESMSKQSYRMNRELVKKIKEEFAGLQ
ncbi:hypothetical protein EZV76_09735 [Flagellimonas alvinocaridis]|uniref:Cardiolipin synthase N-terminal domain-containing protein n=2 Tax=Flagellimonas alvinocaridis TaxID=2530200 RepID=A0A4S8RKV7_9FLAO|nr:hypothetical protein EZV76_09735 [Allomuricauda alvinocaridis]